ncbi:MAG: hypothetical protein GY788_05295 [bacterium]|nr:hypothetical protein [bacterium]
MDATEISIRAERRIGVLMKSQQRNRGGGEPGVGRGGINAVTGEHSISRPPTLADLGMDRNLSARSQKLAAIADASFERDLGA